MYESDEKMDRSSLYFINPGDRGKGLDTILQSSFS